MLTLLGSLLGFAGSALPEVLGYFKTKEANKLEMEKLRLQGELHAQGVELELAVFQARAADDEHARLMAHDQAMSSEQGFFGGLRKSVRPLITYMFFFLFAVIKGATVYSVYHSGTPFIDSVSLIWDAETQAIFAAIISFWFGSRALEKHKR